MNILETLVQLRDDLKTWVITNLNAINAKIDEKTIPIDSELSSTSTNPVQNKTITNAINNIPRFSGSYNDLTDAPNITEDESGNMVIADESGNIIFKADADGIHTTAVSLNGETAATEKYVDDAVANIPTPDVSGQINAHNTNGEAHSDIRQAIEDAKEELSESITSVSDKWEIADEAGNIIFRVDAEGAHTTSLTLDGEKAATLKDIEDAIGGIDKPFFVLGLNNGNTLESIANTACYGGKIMATPVNLYFDPNNTSTLLSFKSSEASLVKPACTGEGATISRDDNATYTITFKRAADGVITAWQDGKEILPPASVAGQHDIPTQWASLNSVSNVYLCGHGVQKNVSYKINYFGQLR